MNLNFKNVKVIPAERENNMHKKGIWKIYNENIEFAFLTFEPVPYEQHCKWWESAFDKEHIYVVLHKSKVVGYIRLTKMRTRSKEVNEISIAFAKDYQNKGLGSYTYNIFEKEMKKIGVKKIVALTDTRNKAGQKFFEKIEFEKRHFRYVKKF